MINFKLAAKMVGACAALITAGASAVSESADDPKTRAIAGVFVIVGGIVTIAVGAFIAGDAFDAAADAAGSAA